MKKIFFIVFLSFLLGVSSYAQTSAPAEKKADNQTAKEEAPKRQTFRAAKDQITEAQKMMKAKNMYAGEADGKYNDDFRAGIKKFQTENGLKATGTLNRATLEKMGIQLTDKQKEIPASADSYVSANSKSDGGAAKPRRMIFRASKEQIMMAQKKLKAAKLYDGEETGKLDDATRDGLKKFQTANNLKSTGTLNQVTLEKMGIELTDKQKENAKTDSQ